MSYLDIPQVISLIGVSMSSDNMSTKPTIETVLERINVLGQQFHTEMESVRESLSAQLGELRGGITELKERIEKQQAEFSAALRKIDRKIEILNDNILSVQADNRDIVIRVEHLESKVL
jgi:hypothetical protein